jgi:hypothetical protein
VTLEQSETGGGITLVGPMLCGGLLRIEGNEVSTSGVGITTSPSNCLVSGNAVIGPGAQAAVQTGSCITLIGDSVFAQAAPMAIDNNTLTGTALAITAEVEQPTQLIRICQNTIQNCNAGMYVNVAGDIAISANRITDLSGQSTANTYGMSVVVADGDVTIGDNQILNLSAQLSQATQTLSGILLNGGNSAAITDNTIDGLSVTLAAGLTQTGVTAIGVTNATTIAVSRNRISNLKCPDQAGAIGIDIEPQFAAADISHNQVIPMTGSGALTPVNVNGTGNKTAAVVSITDNNLTAATAYAAAANVTGNILDFQFSGNTVTAANIYEPAVALTTNGTGATARCHGNVVRAAEPTKGSKIPSIAITGIHVNGAAPVAILGNLTSYQITVNSGALGTPWAPLNVIMTP